MNSEPQAVVDRFKKMGLSIPVDIDHATALKAPLGDPAPAVGWIDALRVLNGGLWGLVRWNGYGRRLISAGEYRHLTPTLEHAGPSRVILGVPSVGLTKTLFFSSMPLSHGTMPAWNAGSARRPLTEDERKILTLLQVSEDEYFAAMHQGRR